MTTIERAAARTGYSVAQIRGPRGKKQLCMVRFAVMRDLRDKGLSLPAIGRLLGRRDHSTIWSGLRRMEELQDDPAFEEIRERLQA